MKKIVLVLLLLSIPLAGCVCKQINGLTPETLSRNASAGPFEIGEGRVYIDNDAAFLSKLRLIEGARTSIDLSYYIFADDQSSSLLTTALLDAARRGVKVRLMVDYATNYRHLDFYSMMEKEGNGNLQVRLYNRPTANIIRDAVYMTMGCSQEASHTEPGRCSADKFTAIDKLFAAETIDGTPSAPRNISNLNIGNSGLFLSGLYAKRGDVLALAVQQGQGIDATTIKGKGAGTSAENKNQLKELGKDYWQAKTGSPFQRLEANAELFFAFALYGQQLNPLKDTITSLLPVDRPFTGEETQDWDHFSDYTHHKLLLVDGSRLQMGGRNVENSYHMHLNPMISKYVFMDTDLYALLTQGGDAVARAFESIWTFQTMVATLAEVRQHAPNDFVANIKYAESTCAAIPAKAERETCTTTQMQTNVHDLEQRMADSRLAMENNARMYRNVYQPTLSAEPAPGFSLDKGSLLAYLENLPFNKDLAADKRVRTYGALAGQEAQAGKYIHDTWLKAIPGVCAAATPADPKRIILHNAYFFPAANLTHALSRLVNGDFDCSNVTVTVLTNSIGTTDLNVVNLAARHSLKAFSEFYQRSSVPGRRAAFEYYEYQPPAVGPNLSLHSKVSVFGDDVVIGSANADVRSFMMDSNNAMLIRNAPEFQRNYLAFVQNILADPGRAKKLNSYFIETPRDVIKSEDLASFHQILVKYRFDKKLSAEKQKQLEGRVSQMLDDAYQMTRDSIATGQSSTSQRENQNRFNQQFKPI